MKNETYSFTLWNRVKQVAKPRHIYHLSLKEKYSPPYKCPCQQCTFQSSVTLFFSLTLQTSEPKISKSSQKFFNYHCGCQQLRKLSRVWFQYSLVSLEQLYSSEHSLQKDYLEVEVLQCFSDFIATFHEQRSLKEWNRIYLQSWTQPRKAIHLSKQYPKIIYHHQSFGFLDFVD